MIVATCALVATLLPQPQGALYTGKLADQPTTDGRMIGMELTPSDPPDMPGWKTGDEALTVHSFVVKQRPASDYTLIEVTQGKPLEDFAFTDFEGRSRKLSDFRGKHLLVDFWGSWCKPCVEDVPMMQQAYDRFRERGFEILGIDFEMGNTSEKVRPFLEEKNVQWVNATPESARILVEDRFRISAFPTLLLLDPNGVVVETRSGQLRGKNLIATLEKIFEKK